MLSKGENPEEVMRKAIEEAQKKRDAQAQEFALTQLLPADLPWKHIHGRIGYRADASLHIEVKDRAEVARCMELIPGVPLVRYKSGCVSFIPEDKLTAAERTAIEDGRGEVEDIAPFMVITEGNKGYGSYLDLGQSVEWYAQIGPFLVDVTCKVNGEHWDARRYTSVERNQQTGEIIRADVTAVEGNSFRLYRFTRYATGDYVSKGNNRLVMFYPPGVPFRDIARLDA
jgi:hypothetical protein